MTAQTPAGTVLLDELDVSVPLTNVSLSDTDDFRHIAEMRDKNSHKGTYGHVVVIGGDQGHCGRCASCSPRGT